MRPGRTTAWLPANTVTLVTGSSTSGAWLAGGAAAGFRSTLPWGHSQTIGMASAGACATFLITARRCGRRVWPSRRRGQMPVSGEGRGPRTPETSASLPMRASRHVSVWFALRTTYERVAGRSADACLCGRTVAMALARRLPSGSVIEPVAARPDTLALGPRSTGVSREAALDRIPGDGMSREPFDGGVGLPHVHRAISLRQRFDDGPLNHAVAQTKLPRRLRRGSGQAALHRAEPGTGQRSPTSVSLRRTATHRSGRPLLRLRREGADPVGQNAMRPIGPVSARSRSASVSMSTSSSVATPLATPAYAATIPGPGPLPPSPDASTSPRTRPPLPDERGVQRPLPPPPGHPDT